MKTKDEVVNGFQSRFLSEIGNVWESGYRQGSAESQEKINDAYEHGLADGTKCTENRCRSCAAYQSGFDDALEMAKKQSIGNGEMIKSLERCANAFAGMEIRNWDGTYTQISYVLREAADMLAKINDSLERITE